MTLAQMLHNTKPNDLCAPNCIGFIDDAAHNDRYGWIFAMPRGSEKKDNLRTLHSLLGQAKYKPTLGERITIAWKLASSLLYLHTVDWLHKGIHSGNVVFVFNGDEFKTSQPILSGFDFSRPQSNRTTGRSLEPKWDLYRWPGIQNEAPKAETSRKTYDIYSLGLVLLEVAHWKPLNELLCLRRWPIPSNQDARTRMWLLGEDFPLFKSNPLPDLREVAGDRY
ncbi:hypothetical protein VHEMI01195 [[Torrubiella] hemipterigena]|uniref:Protein kinase domain-containing protein n=1 Tax=[Torrubiella] hemipterigena TaxID=1531966 RepID=A0A0A1SL80_9HYPO|nr:hypothetical protein VHEMI01195 [[Torrubiella] hemipterigena]